MYTEIDKKLMLKFLEKNYPVSRIKNGLRFKRAIVLDNGNAYHLSNPNSLNQLRHALADTLKLIFDCDSVMIYSVIDSFLPIK